MTGQKSFLVFLGVVALAIVLLAPAASAQKSVTQSAAVTETFTIVAIDQTNRIVTLKDKDGYVDSLYAGPEVKRFNELKVGDAVTFRYYESVVYRIQKPGSAAAFSATRSGITKSPSAAGT